MFFCIWSSLYQISLIFLLFILIYLFFLSFSLTFLYFSFISIFYNFSWFLLFTVFPFLLFVFCVCMFYFHLLFSFLSVHFVFCFEFIFFSNKCTTTFLYFSSTQWPQLFPSSIILPVLVFCISFNLSQSSLTKMNPNTQYIL